MLNPVVMLNNIFQRVLRDLFLKLSSKQEQHKNDMVRSGADDAVLTDGREKNLAAFYISSITHTHTQKNVT